jgi:hypothetical protein
LLFQGANWQCSDHVVWAIAQAHTARSSWPLYGILLRSHFVSQNKIFCCAYFYIHFRIKFLLFNDFPSYLHHWSWLSVNSCAWKSSIPTMAEFSNLCQDGKNAPVCSGIMFKIIILEKEWATMKVVMASLFKFYYAGNLFTILHTFNSTTLIIPCSSFYLL